MACNGKLRMCLGAVQAMSMTPDVSVVMSVYNGASYLATTMDSILSQLGTELELVVVNDGSSDKTVDILNDYARRDHRVRVFHQKNAGLTRALIHGCDAARGEFIARQDVGDISLPGRLKDQVTFLRSQSDCIFVSCWTDVVGPRGEFLYTVRGTGAAAKPIDILSSEAEWGSLDGPTHHSSVLFRTKQYKLCGGYRPEFYLGQDWDLWYRLASLGLFCTLQKTLCVCRVTVGSISTSKEHEQRKFAELSRDAMLMREQGISDEPVLVSARQVLSSAKGKLTRSDQAAANYFIGKCLMDNKDRAASGYLASAVKLNPLHLRAWIGLTQSLFARS
jgi:glycosyltransferase involved in cell wall biosynthesis